jgi:2-polyprenyl-6-methoxyphenol hydroxylase-like FAD-dependent oxidoreductase
MEHITINKTQVVIAGAGPTGLSMAAQLFRHGIDFIIIEKNENTTSLSKAIVVQARTLEIFRELGIAEEAVKRGQVATGLNLFYKGRRKLSIDLSGLGEGISHYPFALSLEQSKTERLLVEHLAANGKQVQWQSELTRFEQDGSGVTVYYKDADQREQKIQALYLVGCDGAGSLIRHQLNFSFKGSTEPKLFYVADVILESPVINTNTLYMYMIKKGFVLFFPMEGKGHYRIVGILPEHDNKSDYSFDDVSPMIRKEIISPVDFTELRWFSTYRVHSRKADAFMQRRCFIAGDAAHIHTPAGGQGMNTGIQDAYNLAWKMAYTIRGEVSTEVLKTYNTERTENAQRLLQTTDRMFDTMSGVNPFWNFVRLNFFAPFMGLVAKSGFVRRKVFPLISQTGIGYPNSWLTIKSSAGKVNAGDRMHYFIFSNGKDIFSYLTEPVFKLLYFSSNKIENPFKDSRIKLSFISFDEVPVDLFGDETKVYVLLRPDNHVVYVGKDAARCREVVHKITSGEC